MQTPEEIRDAIRAQAAEETKLPRIMRQIMRICEAVGVEYGDVSEIRFQPGSLTVSLYDRDAAGQFYLHSNGDPARVTRMFLVDTATFVGDERDF